MYVDDVSCELNLHQKHYKAPSWQKFPLKTLGSTWNISLKPAVPKEFVCLNMVAFVQIAVTNWLFCWWQKLKGCVCTDWHWSVYMCMYIRNPPGFTGYLVVKYVFSAQESRCNQIQIRIVHWLFIWTYNISPYNLSEALHANRWKLLYKRYWNILVLLVHARYTCLEYM